MPIRIIEDIALLFIKELTEYDIIEQAAIGTTSVTNLNFHSKITNSARL